MATPIIAAVLSLFVYSTSAFPRGAPPDICVTNLVPSHGGNRPQPSTGPYTIVASSRSFTPGKAITVILKGSGQTFKGFAIQAQDFQTGEPILNGEWRGSAIKQLPCGAVTHTSPAAKSKVELTWVPKGSGEVVFLATVVETYDTFYVGIKSSSNRNRGTSSNSFYDEKTRASASYATPSDVDDQDAFQSGSVSEDTNSYYDDVSNSQPKEDDGETAAETQAQYDTNYYSPYDPNSGYSQPDFSASSSSVVPSTVEQVSEGQQQQQQDQDSYYSQPNYQFQAPQYQFQRPQRQQVQQQSGPQNFASFQSPSYQSQQFAPPPNYRRPFQPFRNFWNYPRF